MIIPEENEGYGEGAQLPLPCPHYHGNSTGKNTIQQPISPWCMGNTALMSGTPNKHIYRMECSKPTVVARDAAEQSNQVLQLEFESLPATFWLEKGPPKKHKTKKEKQRSIKAQLTQGECSSEKAWHLFKSR